MKTCFGGLIGSCGGDVEIIEKPVGAKDGKRIVTTHKCLKCGWSVIVASRKAVPGDINGDPV